MPLAIFACHAEMSGNRARAYLKGTKIGFGNFDRLLIEAAVFP